MSKRTKPPFRVDHVGSLLRPPALKKAREQRAKGEITPAQLKEIEDREIERVIKKQEMSACNRSPTANFRRSWWHLDFLWGLDGIEKHIHGHRRCILRRDDAQRRSEGDRQSRFFPASDDRALQVRCGPYQAHAEDHDSRAVRRLWAADADPDRPEGLSRNWTHSSRISARPIKKPFALLPMPAVATCSSTKSSSRMLCDPKYRQAMKDRGDDPEKLGELYGDLINIAMSDIPSDMTITMHMCRGNYKSTFMGAGGYEAEQEILFNRIKVPRLLHGV
jgi:5-methyltetrahydropteroyltriglutamate--homocysteine methyltransferase